MHTFTDLSNSRWLSGYVCEMIEAIQDDKTAPYLYSDIREMLETVSPAQMVTIGNPAISATAAWWGQWFGLAQTDEDIAELQEITL
ncbi:hypothetical protein [Citrobacter sp. CK180]|uniref:hypothetical protein n=1 Tax=Citrobacter sp. CK180 TaxID=2985089 RepID=UPI002578F5CE|nr:hypothetical protein [Citrobacter sp. CK180]MDM3066118.1 hypothetical protein [Citrobacter sp. CK180]